MLSSVTARTGERCLFRAPCRDAARHVDVPIYFRARMQPASSSCIDVPFPFINGRLRNLKEAQTLCEIDVLALEAECLVEHLAATDAHERRLEAAARDLDASAPSADAALVLVDSARQALREDLAYIHALAQGVAAEQTRHLRTLKELVEGHRMLHAELVEGGLAQTSLAEAKKRLLSVEESLCNRIQHRLGFGRGKVVTKAALSLNLLGLAPAAGAAPAPGPGAGAVRGRPTSDPAR